MKPQVIPSHWKIKRSTHFFTKDKVPKALLNHHNTAEGVYGQICVMQVVMIKIVCADTDLKLRTIKRAITIIL